TKVAGALLLFTCSSAFLSLVFSTLESGGKFREGGYVGDWLAKELAEILNRTGSLIVVVTLIVLAVIMSTQFSFGRLGATVVGALHETSERAYLAFAEWREARRREKQRREVIAKHTKKAGLSGDKGAAVPEAAAGVVAKAPRKRDALGDDDVPAAATVPA